MKKFGEFLLAKDSHAIAVAFLCALLPIFYIPTGIFAVLIVGLVTFQKGPKAGFWLLTWIALPAIALLVLREVGLFDLLLLRCVIIWLLASLMYWCQRWSLVLLSMTGVCAVVIAVLHWRIPTLDACWTSHLTAYINLMSTEIERLSSKLNWKMTFPTQAIIHKIALVATGVAAFYFSIGIFLELLIARFWQSIVTATHTFGEEFVRIKMHFLAAVGLCVVVALCFLKIKVAVDILPIALFPFFIVGLSLVHFLARRKKETHPAFVLVMMIVFYVLLILLADIMIPLLVLLALADTIFNFRCIQLNKNNHAC